MTKTILVRISVAAIVLLAAGCATAPTPEAMKAEIANFQLPKNPEPGKALVYVVRPSGLGGLIRFNVFLDDQADASEMGYTRASQYIYFNVPPGERKILSKAENWAELAVSAQPGEVIYLQQEPAMGIIMARNSLMRVEDYQGKYYVKTLTPGTIIKTDK